MGRRVQAHIQHIVSIGRLITAGTKTAKTFPVEVRRVLGKKRQTCFLFVLILGPGAHPFKQSDQPHASDNRRTHPRAHHRKTRFEQDPPLTQPRLAFSGT